MDILKEELLKKRQSLSEETGGRKVFKRSEIEHKRIQKRRREEKQEADAKRLCQNPNGSSSNPNLKLDSTKSKPESSAASISNEQSLDLPKQEVIRRLRLLKQPVTLFGESDGGRLDRLHAGSFESEGQRNDKVELKRMDKFEYDANNFSELCDEDKILVFFNKLLIEWNQELNEMTETEKRTARGKLALATFKQCVRSLDPLFNLCRKKFLHDDIRQALILVVNCCMKKDHSAASDHYMKIAIGKSAWPIGVTMVGIHERSAREKISTNSVAHVMKDETTRKYLTSVKRLMTFCERRHPPNCGV